MKKITVEELRKHNTKESLWICIDNKIYDVTTFTKHPGQFEILLKHGGKDATKKFHNIHSEKAFKMKDKFYIGDLDSNKLYILKLIKLLMNVILLFIIFNLFLHTYNLINRRRYE